MFLSSISKFILLSLVALGASSWAQENLPKTADMDTCAPGPTGLCLSVVGLSASGQDADEVAEQLAVSYEAAARENPNVILKIANVGSAAADYLTAKIMVKSKVPIEDLTPRERIKLYASTPEYRENFVFALVRGGANSVGSTLTLALVVSDLALSPQDLLPSAFAIFFMSGGIQVGIDPFHLWLKNGSWSQALIPGLRQPPVDPVLLPKWQGRRDRWAEREFYAKWFATQFVFMCGIDLALIPSGIWNGQTLGMVLAKTLVNSLFAMFAEGAPEGLIVDGARALLEKAKASRRAKGELDEITRKKLEVTYDRYRRGLVAMIAVGSTALGLLRNSQSTLLWQVFVPTDTPGFILFSMGLVCVSASKIISWQKNRSCGRCLFTFRPKR
jgi:hypothetical protein